MPIAAAPIAIPTIPSPIPAQAIIMLLLLLFPSDDDDPTDPTDCLIEDTSDWICVSDVAISELEVYGSGNPASDLASGQPKPPVNPLRTTPSETVVVLLSAVAPASPAGVQVKVMFTGVSFIVPKTLYENVVATVGKNEVS